MKRNLRRIIGIVLVLIGVCHNFCYADVITTTPQEMFIPVAWLGVVIVGLIVFIMSVISFYALKATDQKDVNINVDVDANEKKLNKSKRRIYVWGIILAIMGHLFSQLWFNFGSLLFLIPIIIFIISIAIRKSSKKVSNIICIISICIILIIPIGCSIKGKMVENYNDKFDSKNYNSVTELIHSVIENNEKNKNQIVVEYNNREYKTTSELNSLVNILNKGYTYYTWDNGSKYSREYLTKIYLYSNNK